MRVKGSGGGGERGEERREATAADRNPSCRMFKTLNAHGWSIVFFFLSPARSLKIDFFTPFAVAHCCGHTTSLRSDEQEGSFAAHF